jgi:hypothetical protein
MRARLATVPSDHTFAFSGVDPGGQHWTRQVTVSFMGEQPPAAILLSSTPDVVRQNPKGDPNCPSDRPFYQQLNVQELTGQEVWLTRFLAGGADFSGQIESWFGSVRLAPFGALRANICWKLDTLPAIEDFEVGGIDAAGHPVKASLQVTFKSAALIPTTLAVSKSSLTLSSAMGPVTTTIDVTLRGDENWAVSVFPANRKSAWLNVSPASGRGPRQVTVVASADGLPNGVYTATLTFQSENSIPQFINVPVVFLVGAADGSAAAGRE